jgi:thiamine kinase-like enzyme
MIRRPDKWLSVDWEYAGWGDPAFSIAELITHPAYSSVPPARWRWFTKHYCASREDSSAALRIEVYTQTLLIWWTIRFARLLVEVPRGQDKRLVERPTGWLADKQVEYQHYLAIAQESLNVKRKT